MVRRQISLVLCFACMYISSAQIDATINPVLLEDTHVDQQGKEIRFYRHDIGMGKCTGNVDYTRVGNLPYDYSALTYDNGAYTLQFRQPEDSTFAIVGFDAWGTWLEAIGPPQHDVDNLYSDLTHVAIDELMTMRRRRSDFSSSADDDFTNPNPMNASYVLIVSPKIVCADEFLADVHHGYFHNASKNGPVKIETNTTVACYSSKGKVQPSSDLGFPGYGDEIIDVPSVGAGDTDIADLVRKAGSEHPALNFNFIGFPDSTPPCRVVQDSAVHTPGEPLSSSSAYVDGKEYHFQDRTDIGRTVNNDDGCGIAVKCNGEGNVQFVEFRSHYKLISGNAADAPAHTDVATPLYWKEYEHVYPMCTLYTDAELSMKIDGNNGDSNAGWAAVRADRRTPPGSSSPQHSTLRDCSAHESCQAFIAPKGATSITAPKQLVVQKAYAPAVSNFVPYTVYSVAIAAGTATYSALFGVGQVYINAGQVHIDIIPEGGDVIVNLAYTHPCPSSHNPLAVAMHDVIDIGVDVVETTVICTPKSEMGVNLPVVKCILKTRITDDGAFNGALYNNPFDWNGGGSTVMNSPVCSDAEYSSTNWDDLVLLVGERPENDKVVATPSAFAVTILPQGDGSQQYTVEAITGNSSIKIGTKAVYSVAGATTVDVSTCEPEGQHSDNWRCYRIAVGLDGHVDVVTVTYQTGDHSTGHTCHSFTTDDYCALTEITRVEPLPNMVRRNTMFGKLLQLSKNGNYLVVGATKTTDDDTSPNLNVFGYDLRYTAVSTEPLGRTKKWELSAFSEVDVQFNTLSKVRLSQSPRHQSPDTEYQEFTLHDNNPCPSTSSAPVTEDHFCAYQMYTDTTQFSVPQCTMSGNGSEQIEISCKDKEDYTFPLRTDSDNVHMSRHAEIFKGDELVARVKLATPDRSHMGGSYAIAVPFPKLVVNVGDTYTVRVPENAIQFAGTRWNGVSVPAQEYTFISEIGMTGDFPFPNVIHAVVGSDTSCNEYSHLESLTAYEDACVDYVYQMNANSSAYTVPHSTTFTLMFDRPVDCEGVQWRQDNNAVENIACDGNSTDFDLTFTDLYTRAESPLTLVFSQSNVRVLTVNRAEVKFIFEQTTTSTTVTSTTTTATTTTTTTTMTETSTTTTVTSTTTTATTTTTTTTTITETTTTTVEDTVPVCWMPAAMHVVSNVIPLVCNEAVHVNEGGIVRIVDEGGENKLTIPLNGMVSGTHAVYWTSSVVADDSRTVTAQLNLHVDMSQLNGKYYVTYGSGTLVDAGHNTNHPITGLIDHYNSFEVKHDEADAVRNPTIIGVTMSLPDTTNALDALFPWQDRKSGSSWDEGDGISYESVDCDRTCPPGTNGLCRSVKAGQLTCAGFPNGRCLDYDVHSGVTGANVDFRMQFASTVCPGDGGFRHRRAVSAYKPTKVEHPDVHKPGAVYRYEQGSNSVLTLVFDREIPDAASLMCIMYDVAGTRVASLTGTREFGGTALKFDLTGLGLTVAADYLFECDFDMRLPAPGTLRSANVGAAVAEPKYIPTDAVLRSPELIDASASFSDNSHAHPDPSFYTYGSGQPVSGQPIRNHRHVNYTVAIVEGQALTIDLITTYPSETGVLVIHPTSGNLYLHKDPANFSFYDIWAHAHEYAMATNMVSGEPYRWEFTEPGNYIVTHVDSWGDVHPNEKFEVSVRRRAKSSLSLRDLVVPPSTNMAVKSEKLLSEDQLKKRESRQVILIAVGVAVIVVAGVLLITTKPDEDKGKSANLANDINYF